MQRNKARRLLAELECGSPGFEVCAAGDPFLRIVEFITEESGLHSQTLENARAEMCIGAIAKMKDHFEFDGLTIFRPEGGCGGLVVHNIGES